MQQAIEVVRYFMISCEECRNSHRKCDRRLPICQQCRERNFPCCYRTPKKQQSSTTTRHKTRHHNNRVQSTTCEIERDHLELFTRIPSIVSLNNDSFDSRVKKAGWLASRAFLLLHVPIEDQMRVNLNAPSVLYANLEHELKKFGSVVSDLSDLHSLALPCSSSDLVSPSNGGNHVRRHVQKTAERMFKEAKQMILNPDLYLSIADNEYLASACTQLAYYLIGSSGDLNEVKLLLSAVRVFEKRKRSILDVNLSAVFSTTSEQDRLEIEQLQNLVAHVARSYAGAQYVIFVNESMNRSYVPTTKKLLRAIESMRLLCISPTQTLSSIQNMNQFHYLIANQNGNSNGSLSSHSLFQYESIFHNLKSIIIEYGGYDRFTKVMDQLEQLMQSLLLVNDFNIGSDISGNGNGGSASTTEYILSHAEKITFLCVVYMTQYCFTTIELNNTQNTRYTEHIRNKLKQIKLQLANQITDIIHGHLQMMLNGASNGAVIMVSVCEAQMEHARELLLEPFITIESLQSTIRYLQLDVDIFLQMRQKYDISIFDQPVIEARKCLELLESKLQQLQVQQISVQQSLNTTETSAMNSDIGELFDEEEWITDVINSL